MEMRCAVECVNLKGHRYIQTFAAAADKIFEKSGKIR